MTVKLEIHEICPKCGKVAARQDIGGTVYVIGHDCVVKIPGTFEYPRSFRYGEVIFVPMIDTIKTLQDKNKRLSSDLGEMAKDCAKLQKVLLDIGSVVRDTLGIEIGSKLSPRAALAPGSWKCTCDMWNYPSRDSCTNCGRQNKGSSS